MIDLDGFKRVNDLRGHARGDAMLQAIARALSDTTRASDVTGRYGGDEFVVILPDTDPEAAQGVAERIAGAVREVGESTGDDKPVTASVGIAAARPIDDVASLLHRADENAYRAKQSGGNRVAA
jgi:diguanylate cyclase (GGDEF)-like protein